MLGDGFKDLLKTYFAKFLISFASIALLTKLGVWCAIPPYYVTPLWLVTGASLGIIILFGFKFLPAIILGLITGFFFHNYSSVALFIVPLKITVGLTLFTLIIVLIKLLLFKWYIIQKIHRFNAQSVVYVFGLVILMSAFAFMILFFLSEHFIKLPSHLIPNVYTTWIFADLAGTILITPVFFSPKFIDTADRQKLKQTEFLIIIFVFIALLLICWRINIFNNFTFLLLYIPLFLFISLRYNPLNIMMVAGFIYITAAINIILNITEFDAEQFFKATHFYQGLVILTIPTALLLHVIFQKYREQNRILVEEKLKLQNELNELRHIQIQNLEKLEKANIGLEESELRFNSLSQITDDGIILHANGHIIDVNQAFCNMSEYRREDLIGKSISNFLITNPSTLNAIIKSQLTLVTDISLKCEDNQLKIVELKIRDAELNGEHIQAISFKNITSQVEAIRTVFVLKSAIEQSPATILITDPEGRIEYVNPAFTKITGYTIEEVIGKKPNILKSGFHSDLFYKDLWTRITNGEIWKGEFLNYKKDGTEYWETATIAPVLKENRITHFICTKEDITEHKKNRESILESEQKYRLLAENVADVIWVSDKNLKYTYISPSVESITGFSNEEIKTLPFEIYLPKIPRELLADLARLKRSDKGDSESFERKWETQFRVKSGNIIWLETKIQPIFSINEKFNGIIGVSRDITKRKLSEIALKESEEKFRSFFENTNTVLLVVNPETSRIESANNAAIQYFGYTLEEFSTLRFSDIFNTEFDNLKSYFSNTIQERGKMIALKNKLKNGRIKDVEIFTTPIQVGDETLLYTIVQDVSSRKKAISALKESELKKLALLKIIPDLIYIVNRTGILLDVYTDKPSKLSLPPEQMVGHSFINMLPPELRVKFIEMIESVFESRAIKTMNYSFSKDGRQVFEEARLIMSTDDELLIIIRDMTELKISERELKRAWEEAEKANNAKSIFLANISHEIRTPINAIIGFTELIDYELTDKNLKNYLASIKSSSKTLLSLIEDLLDLSKIEAGELTVKIEPASIRGIFKEIYQIFWLKIHEKKLAFNIVVPDDLPDIVFIDELRLRQILMNLISNAYKFTEEGSIQIIMTFKESNDIKGYPFIDLNIEVKDTGIGVPKEYQELIFEAFKQQDEQDSRKYGGTGLGLAITKRLVQIMKGTITLKSEPGRGSSFLVKLPSVKVKYGIAVGSSSKKDEYYDVVFKNAQILIVDDIYTNRILLKNCIRGEDVTVIEAIDGEEAIELVNTFKPDIVLLDLNLPKINGFLVAEHVKTNIKDKNIPIIAISATRLSDSEREKWEYFDAFIAKPFKTKEIIQELMKYLEFYNPADDLVKTTGPKITENLIDNDRIKSPLFMTVLEELLQHYSIIRESSSFEEIKKYASKLKETGNEFNIKLLQQTGVSMFQSAENFDIEAILNLMHEIPQIINRIKSEIPK